jgi:hypothetical protein
LSLAAACTASAQVSITIRQLVPNGGRVSWYKGNAAHSLIAFDAANPPGQLNSDVFTITPDRTNLRCVTCSSPIPDGFVGQPVWHPNGQHLALQAESPHSRHSFYNSVLWGFDNDIWFIRRDGAGAEKIWATPKGWAVLHPQFSRDGTTLMFGERVWDSGNTDPFDNWRIRIVDFDITKTGPAKLSNHRVIQPSGPGFYEPHEFAPGGRLLYSHAAPGRRIVDDIHIAMLDGTSPINLTGDPSSWDEHGHLSPANPFLLAFMSSRFDPTPPTEKSLRTELYLGVVGGTPLRITQFNQTPDDLAIVKDLDWDRTGTQIAFLVSSNRFTAPQIWIVSLS